MKNTIYYLMGVSGSGKTTVGEKLSEKLDIPFYDSDQFHPDANIEKMSAGIPLNDEDRQSWLQAIHDFVLEQLHGGSLIIATSALKESYRDLLDGDLPEDQVRWIFLYGNYKLLYDRIAHRKGHFMPESLLKSQFEALEVPHQNVIAVEVDKTIEEIVDEIVRKM